LYPFSNYCLKSCRGYIPPEYIEKRQISKKYDVFSLGVIILQIIAGPSGHSKRDEVSPERFIEDVRIFICVFTFMMKQGSFIFTSCCATLLYDFTFKGKREMEEKVAGDFKLHIDLAKGI
jgi:serine/threonine protein kinase